MNILLKSSCTCKFFNCNKYLINPVLLPCSSNICKSHVDDMIQHNQKNFICSSCQKEHEIPKEGFIINSFAKKTVESNMHLNDKEKSIAILLAKLGEKINNMKCVVQDPQGFIHEYISETRNKIDLERERLVNEICTLSNEMVNRLNLFEYQCLENLKSLNCSYDFTNEPMFNIDSEISNWKEELRTPDISMPRLDELLKTTSELLADTEEYSFIIKNDFLMNNGCHFVSKNIKFDETLFGEFKIDETISHENMLANDIFKSFILTSSQANDLIKLCSFKMDTTFELIYRASLDGFSAESFHKRCDGQSKTLTVVKVKDSPNVFGGYCRKAWDSFSKFKKDSKAFIFSLVNKYNDPLKIEVANAERAIYCASGYGPTFGNDITIKSDSNINNKSYTELENSYSSGGRNPNGSIDQFYYLTNSYHFMTEEIEVYRVQQHNEVAAVSRNEC